MDHIVLASMARTISPSLRMNGSQTPQKFQKQQIKKSSNSFQYFFANKHPTKRTFFCSKFVQFNLIPFIQNPATYCEPNPTKEADYVYEAGQAISKSYKFDLWRARHRNVQIIGDLKPFTLFLTYVRDATISGEDFVRYADLLMRFLLSFTYTVLPKDEKSVVTTTSGYKFKGHKLGSNTEMVAFVVTTESHPEWLRPFAEVLGACFPGASVGELAVSWPEEWEPDVVWRWHTPSPKKKRGLKGGLQLRGCTAVLFCPIVATGYSAEIAVRKIIAAGTNPKEIVLTSIIMSMEGLTYLSEQFPLMKIIVGEIDPDIDQEGLCVPGMGDFVGRYMDHRKDLDLQ